MKKTTSKTAKTTSSIVAQFLQVTALAGGGVIIGMYAPALAQEGRGGPPPSTWSLAPATYITVHPDNTFTILAKNPETGQGIRTALPQIIADEFDIDWSQVKIQQADLNPKYGPQFEGGSRAIPTNYDPMRQVGAAGRLMMVTAAAQQWNVPATELTTGSGVVTHAASRRTATYASLASRVASMTPPTVEAVKAAYKDPKNFKIIGKPIKGVDNLAIVTGKPSFSVDVEPAGMLSAVFEKCPVFGGKAMSANLDEVKRLPGHQTRVHRRRGRRARRQLAGVGRGDRGGQLVAGEQRAPHAESGVGRRPCGDAEQRRVRGAGQAAVSAGVARRHLPAGAAEPRSVTSRRRSGTPPRSSRRSTRSRCSRTHRSSRRTRLRTTSRTARWRSGRAARFRASRIRRLAPASRPTRSPCTWCGPAAASVVV